LTGVSGEFVWALDGSVIVRLVVASVDAIPSDAA